MPVRDGWERASRRNMSKDPADRTYQYGENRKAWVRTSVAELVWYERDEPENAPQRDLAIKTGSKTVIVHFGAMTALELAAVQRFLADHLGQPLEEVVTRLDEEAVRAYEEDGEDSNPRLYRPAPLLVDRSRGERPHGALLHKRLVTLPQVPDDVDGPESADEQDGVPQHGDLVAEREQGQVERQDDPAAPDGM